MDLEIPLDVITAGPAQNTTLTPGRLGLYVHGAHIVFALFAANVEDKLFLQFGHESMHTNTHAECGHIFRVTKIYN